MKDEDKKMAIFGNKRNSMYDQDENVFEPITVQEIPERKPEAVQSMLQMKVVRPTDLKQATEIADSLKMGQTIVLNLDELSDTQARRMLDYIAGVLYAVNGKIERPSDRTFLLTPKGVSIDTHQKTKKYR
jgi:cell division inhibitor SepF